MNYNHLYYFFVIAREGSITRATRILHLAQPTLSAQLKTFEKSIGRILFERAGPRLVLTEYGRAVFDYAQKIFGLAGELRGMISGAAVPSDMTLNIGIQTGTPKAFCHALMSHVLTSCPAARVRLREAPLEALLQDLENLSLDVIMTDSPVSPTRARHALSLRIGRVPLLFVASPALARSLGSRPGKTGEVRFILPSDPSPVYHEIKDWLSSSGIPARVVAEVQDVEIARRLAISGFGVAPINAYTVSVSLPAKALRVLGWKIKHPIHESIYLVHRERHLANPLVEDLVGNFRIKAD